jgi:hypothetical protein
MASIVMIRAGPPAGCLRACLSAASGAAKSPAGHSLAVATLISWLLAELLGAYMLRSWFASGGARQRRSRLDTSRRPDTSRPDTSQQDTSRPDTSRLDTISLPLVLGHAGLAFAGFTCWVSFLISEAVPLAWLSIGFLAPAIGLGISTVTVWTPYPARRPERLRSSGAVQPRDLRADATLDDTLADEELTSKLVEDLLARMLAAPASARRPRMQLAPLVPILHGVLALTTFLLAMLAAIAAVARV